MGQKNIAICRSQEVINPVQKKLLKYLIQRYLDIEIRHKRKNYSDLKFINAI